jgi:hypothetical protein
MIKTTAAYKEALKEKGIFHHKAIIDFPDGSNDTVEDLDIYTFQISDGTSNTSSFDLGAAIAQQLTLKINNIDGRFDEHDFNGAVITAQVGLELLNGSVEWLDKGKFTAEPGEESGNSISVKAFDDMTKFDQPYSLSKLVYPATLGTIVRDACSCCGVTLASDTVTFDNDNFIVQNRPDDSALTFRQVLQWVGQIACKFFRIDRFGKLSARWYNTDLLEATWARKEDTIWTDIAGNAILDSEGQEIGTAIEIPLKNGNSNIIDADNSDEILKISDLLTGSTIQTDDVVITGIRVNEEDGDSTEEITYQSGAEGYILEISGNKLIQSGSGATVAAYLGERLNGIQFRPMSVSTPADPAREAGDLGLVIDAKKRYHKTIFTNVEYTAHTSQNLISGAEAPTRLSSTRYSQATQVYKELRANLKRQKTEWDTAFDNLQEAMKTKNGLFPIHETMEDGSTILYFCDKPELSEATIVVKFSAAGWGMSTDGGKTWNSGWLVDGTMIAAILNVIGVNAKWINAGALIVKDSDGKTIFEVDMDKKSVYMDPDMLTIGGMPLSKKLASMDENIASAKNMTLTLSNEYQGITSDADGNIPTFPTVATTASVMYGSQDVTNDCSYTITKSDSVTGSWDVNTHTYTVTGLIADNGWVDIKATYLQTLSITRRFTIAKLKAGKNGVNGLDGLQGEKGEQGVPGKDGKDGTNGVDGKTSYFHIKYSSVANPTSSSQMTETPSTYIGTYVDYEPNDSTDPKKYTWSKFEGSDGKDGIAGTNGTDGKTYYLHIAYANSADGKTGFSVSDGTNKLYIGQYTDTTKTDSTDPTKYTWSKIKGETGADGKPGRTYIIEPSCNVLKRGADKNVSPNFLKFNAYYRDGDSATRYAYKGRFVIEETTDGNTWKTIYTSSTDEDTVTHYLYTILTNSSSETISNSNGSTIGIPRDVTNVRCKLYASGGTTTLMDMQSVAVVIDVDNLTQEQIVKILSDDGKWNGLYYRNGKLYISFSSAMGGSLLLGGKNNSEGFLKILDKTNKAKALADYSGFTCFSNYSETNGVAEYDGIRFSETGIEPVSAKKNLPERPDNPTNPDGSVDIEYSDGSPWWSIDISKNSDGESIMSIYGAENITGAYGEFDSLNTDGGNQRAEAFSVKDVFYAKETITNTGEDVFYAKFEKELACRAGLRVYSLPTITSGWNCYIDQNNYKVSALSSSSKRYKILGASLPEEFIENLYNIEPIMARYKKGYLAKGDERVDAEFPMFIAEDVDKYFPLAVDHNTDGLPENWNERIMIPAMFAMIKAQKKKIDQQEKLINKLCEKLNIE